MPNKLRFSSREEVATNLVNNLTVADMKQICCEYNLDWLKDIGSEEIIEIFEDQPELWAEPTLKQQLDDIFYAYNKKVQEAILLETQGLLKERVWITVAPITHKLCTQGKPYYTTS